MLRVLVVAMVVLTAVALLPRTSHADGAWLDAPLVQWNSPGADVPVAPPNVGLPGNPNCPTSGRPPETDEDAAVVGAGWTLFGTYQAGWGVKVIHGEAGYDGMCRPDPYQVFVFVDGVFAGTIAPSEMGARTDGSENQAVLQGSGDRLLANFSRYAPDDPLCCPSRISTVMYRIDTQDGLPVLVATSVDTHSAR